MTLRIAIDGARPGEIERGVAAAYAVFRWAGITPLEAAEDMFEDVLYDILGFPETLPPEIDLDDEEGEDDRDITPARIYRVDGTDVTALTDADRTEHVIRKTRGNGIGEKSETSAVPALSAVPAVTVTGRDIFRFLRRSRHTFFCHHQTERELQPAELNVYVLWDAANMAAIEACCEGWQKDRIPESAHLEYVRDDGPSPGRTSSDETFHRL